MPNSLTVSASGKVIRDPIHGDIVIKDKFVDLIDTPEFQRLRRISQLGLTNLLFPAAEHSRFSHSIGTYHIMQLLIDHFKKILTDLDLEEELGVEKINLALAAALLHDIGHGPLSHTFERITEEILAQGGKSHEEWTQEIILNSESQIRKVLEKNFGAQFPEQVANLIGNNYQWQQTEETETGFKQIHLLNILSSLVSSQIDADRMDYLLRDTYFTGVAYGQFDLSRLINSLSIIREGKNYYVCIPEKYLSTVEEYLIARYQMYKEIYSHSFKREMELILSQIMVRANYLYQYDKLQSELPAALKSLFTAGEITVANYIALDDVSIWSLVKDWQFHSDDILAKLCRVFLTRRKFTQLNLGDNTPAEVTAFKAELTSILEEYGFNKKLAESYFWLEADAEEDLYQELYQEEEEQISIVDKRGYRRDFLEVSKVIRRAKDDGGSKRQKIIFINFSVLQKEVSANQELITKVQKLLAEYSPSKRK